MYANLILDNPNNIPLADHFEKAAAKLAELIRSNDRAALERHLRALAAFQPPEARDRAFDDTQFINRALANRSIVEARLDEVVPSIG